MTTLPPSALGEVRLDLNDLLPNGTDRGVGGYAYLYPNLRPGTIYRASGMDALTARKMRLVFDGSGNLEDPTTGANAQVLASNAPGITHQGLQWVLDFHLTGVSPLEQPPTRYFTVPAGGYVNVGLLLDTTPQPALVTVVSEQTRIDAEAARDQAEEYRDESLEHLELFTAPADTVIASLVDDTHETTALKTALDAYRFDRFPPALGLFHAAMAARRTRPVVIVGAGSSTMAGNNASTAERRFWNLLRAAVVAAYPGGDSPPVRSLASAAATPPTTNGIHFVNAGVSSTQSSDYLTLTTGGQVAALNPAVVVHMIGSNDYGANVNPNTYESRVTARIAQIDADATGTVLHILVHPYERTDVTGRTYDWADYGAAMRRISVANPGRVVFFDLSPYYYTAVQGTGNRYSVIDSDNLHQTDTGHAMMADLLRRFLHIPERVGALPSVQVSPSRITSDGFTGDGAIVGRTTDLYVGGAAKTWEGTGGFTAAGSKIVGSTSTSSHFVGFPIPPTSVQVSAVVDVLPTAGLVYLDFCRATSVVDPAPNTYRIQISPTTVELQKRVSNVTTTFFTMSASRVVGEILTGRWYAGRPYLLLNGEVIFSVADDSVNRGGYAGIARAGSATDFQLDRFFVDILG